MERSQVVVVGAGAAGLMAAIFAAREGRSVTVLEATPDGGRKILISGGGRCNVLPERLSVDRYVTASSIHSLRKILLSWPLDEQRSFFEGDLRIPLRLEPETGKLFPESNRARDIRDGLITAAQTAGARLLFSRRVTALEPQEEGGWCLTSGVERYAADSVILATGGLSVPKTGSDGAGLNWLSALECRVNQTYPALTPLTLTPPVHADLAGVSLEVTLDAPPPGGPIRATGGFLFTHRGYSGPAVLDVSHVAVRAGPNGEQKILVQWGPDGSDQWDQTLTDTSGGRVASVLRRNLPARLADRLASEAGVDGERTLSQLRRHERAALVETLTRYPLRWTGDEGYKKAEVTGGGLALSEVHSATLESKRHPRLYVCGEILDAFGPIGGHNFAWAWATGRTAGRSAAASLTNR